MSFTQLNISALELYTTDELVAFLDKADQLYFDGEDSFLEDFEYDAVKLYVQRLDPKNAYFGQVGSEVRGGKVDLPSPMGSLDQVYDGDTVKWLKKHKIQDDEEIVLSDKLDGNSVLLVYSRAGKFQSAFTRGDGFQGADVTRHVLKMPSVPKSITASGETILIRAENIISPRNFKIINSGKYSRGGRVYKNPRNMVAGQMNASDVRQEILNIIDCVAYEVVGATMGKRDQFRFLHSQGFLTAVHGAFNANQINDLMLADYLANRRQMTQYEIDGIVIDVDSLKTRQRIGTEDLNPTYSVKFKIADVDNTAVTTVTNIDWNISKNGYCKPRVQFEAVNLVGVTIKNATGFNAQFIKDNKLGPGAKIRIVRSGDVIPFIAEVVAPAPGGAQMPTESGHWSPSGADFIIDDAHTNETVAFEQLKDFFSSMEVDHLGEGNLKPMFEAGFTKPEMIIPMTQEDFGSLVGSMAIGKKIFAGMRKAFTNVPLYKLMGSHPSMGRGVGVRKMKKLYDAWDGQMQHCESITRITDVAGFDNKTAIKIQGGYSEFMEFYRGIAPYVTIAKFVAKKTGQLSGKVFVFTGFRSAELESKIVDQGGTIGSGVSSKTSYLVTAEPNSQSGKAVKARAAGVSVIGVEELKQML